MVHPALALHQEDVYTLLPHDAAAHGLRQFLETLPAGTRAYDQAARRFVLELYSAAADSDAQYFLDKTPSYSFLASDIVRIMEGSKFIFLWRNPLAIAGSLLRSFRQGGWNLYQYEADLYIAMNELVRTYQHVQERSVSLRYEDLVMEPQPEIQRVLEYLEVEYTPSIIEHFSETQLKGYYGDPNARKPEYQVLRDDRVEAWKNEFRNPLRRRWARRYIDWLGEERLSIMGYGKEELLQSLDEIPFSLENVSRDAYRMPYGRAYIWIGGRMLRDKIRRHRDGGIVAVHK